MTDSSDQGTLPPRYLIGVGASAGGLEALSQLVAALPDGLDCSYVIAQHLSPSYPSMMVDLLQRETLLPVDKIEDGTSPVANHIYVTPPNFNVVLRDGQLRLDPPDTTGIPKPSVDLLLRSIAEEYGEFSVGVVLSGTGHDGAQGIRAIKAAGGITFAQDPSSAKYSGMPSAAIETDALDRVLSASDIAADISSVIRTHHFTTTEPSTDNVAHKQLSQLWRLVRSRTKIDFSGYKDATLARRLARRMALTANDTLSQYLEFVDSNPSELESLSKEILISVTAFFRDRESFDILDGALDALLESRPPATPVRIWVPGCATGEEAYSIAIIMMEKLRTRFVHHEVQIFATDIDVAALSHTRRGNYRANTLTELEPELRERYFTRRGGFFEVRKEIRDMLVVARQDLVSDPPFPRLDLISCRNLLIYLRPELQGRVLSQFYYSLNSGGLLYLGRSENITIQEELFAPVSSKARLFHPIAGKHPVVRNQGRLNIGPTRRGAPEPSPGTDPLSVLSKSMLSRFAPPSVLIDNDARILHSHGNLDHYLSFPSGIPRLNLQQLIQRPFRPELLALLHQARKHRKFVRGQPVVVQGVSETVTLSIDPIETADSILYVVSFQETEASQHKTLDYETNNDLADELSATREHLQTVIQELETSNEEMQALTEEVQASNEELQATNEEMEAANEELQATNQELSSVNEELFVRTTELAATNNEYINVQDNLKHSLLVTNSDMIVTRINRAAIAAFGFIKDITGQHITGLPFPRFADQTPEIVAKVMRTGLPETANISDGDTHYTLDIVPYTNPNSDSMGTIITLIDVTDLSKAQRLSAASERRLTQVMDNSSAMYSVKSLDGRYLFANQKYATFFGLSVDSIIGRHDTEILPRSAAQVFRRHDLESLDSTQPHSVEHEIWLNGNRHVLEAVRFSLESASGNLHAICLEARDITQKRHAEEQLRLAAKVFHRSGEAISITDAKGIILTVNDAFTEVTGYSRDEAVGKTPSLLKSGRHTPEFYSEMWGHINEFGWWQGEIWNRRKNGEIYPEWLTVNSVKDETGAATNYVGVFSDISAIKDSQRRIEFLATHDELTRLPNRALFSDRLKHAIARCQRHRTNLVVVFVDLDNFKVVNDSLGHDFGDELLKQAAERLRESIRAEDTVARLGGDEFTILLEDVEPGEATQTISRLIDYISATYRIRGRELYISASVGASVFPHDGNDSDTLLKHADAAMYRAKDLGKNQFQFFAAEMKVRAHQRLAIETGLRVALDQDEFYMVYQPKVDMRTTAVIGAEALLRWKSSTMNAVSPATFIPIAEQSGLVGRIGATVIDMVLEQMGCWSRRGITLCNIAINVCPHQFRDERMVQYLHDAISASGIAPELITLEITEGVLMDRSENVARNLDYLKELGIRVSIDDFGTGYSSLSYLKHYPISEIKIDRSFVDGIVDDEDSRSIAATIIGMARSLGKDLVAEGVETEEQAVELLRGGCRTAQGFLYHKPMSAEQFGNLLAAKDGNQ